MGGREKSERERESEGISKTEDCMRDCMRKLALWYTRTFKPIMTHDELDPIMATLGFVPVPSSSSSSAAATAWKEYLYSAGGSRTQFQFPQIPPRPRLPHPRIDGLHIYTYRAFLDALNSYLQMPDISDLFHIRGMPLNRVHDRSKKWRRMEEDDSIFVYKEGTLDQAVHNLYHNKNEIKSSSNKGCNSTTIRDKGNNTPAGRIVPLKDIIV